MECLVPLNGGTPLRRTGGIVALAKSSQKIAGDAQIGQRVRHILFMSVHTFWKHLFELEAIIRVC